MAEHKRQCQTVWLKAYLNEGVPGPEHFDIRETTVCVDSAALKDGDIALEVMAMSVDPYLRGGLKNKTNDEGSGERVMSGFVSGKILASKHEGWKEGDLFGAALPFSTVQIVSREGLAKTLAWKLTGLVEEKNISHGIGVMGMPGSTAYGGLIDVLRPNKEETIFVSAASGAVGSLVGQIAKQVYDCKVIGSCGGPEKNAFIKEQYGFDHAIDYRSLPKEHDAALEELITRIKKCAPDGIDMYYENVGGVHFEAAMATLRFKGRVAVCGAISAYNDKKAASLSIQPMNMIYQFQRVEGFTCRPWLSGQKGNFLKDMSQWLKEGKVKVEETFFDGVESWPVAFQSLFTGKKRGKVVVRVQHK